MTPVLRDGISFHDARWDSIAQLLDEADTFLRGRGTALQGLSRQRIDDSWRATCADHEPPSDLQVFLLRAGENAPFLNPNLEDTYRPEHYDDNRRSAERFLMDFPFAAGSAAFHCVGESGRLSAHMVVIACDAVGETYYCVDASDISSPVFGLHAPHGELKEAPMTMLEFLRLELLNYWIDSLHRGG
jgi:hypothetical protein